MKTLLNFLVMMVMLPSILFAQSKGEMPFTSSSPEAQKLLRQAWVAYGDARINEAGKYIQQAIEKDPRFGMAYASRWSNNEEETSKNLNIALGLTLSADEKMYLNGLKAANEGKPTQEYFEPLLKKYPEDYSLHLWIMFYCNDINRSVEIGEKMVENNPLFAPAYNILGYKYMEQNDLVKAEICFDKYIELRPDLANVYDSKGDYLMRADKFEEAIQLYERAFAMDERNMKISKTKADKAKSLLRGFSVPLLTNNQKHISTTGQAWGFMVAGISTAKQSGVSVRDYATQMGDLFKHTWNRDMGFEGLVRGVLYNFECFRDEKDPAVEIIHQDKNSIQFKWDINYKKMFSNGSVYNVSFEEMTEALCLMNKQIAEYLGCSVEHEVDGDWLTVTIYRIGL
jgi:tetratricopeptide (TPR) repeat protein